MLLDLSTCLVLVGRCLFSLEEHQRVEMLLEFGAVLEALEHVVARVEILHAAIHLMVESRR